MKNHLRIAPVVLLAAFLAGCQGPCSNISRVNAPTLTSGTADFTRFAAVGTSISAGWQSGGLVNRHQVHAFPALFAQQVGKTVLAGGTGTFSFPAVGGNGKPALMRIVSLSPLVINNAGLADGDPLNVTYPYPYANMAVPGAVAADFSGTDNYAANGMFALVARGLGPVGLQMLSENPTFISFEYGANEVLGPATHGLGSAYMEYGTQGFADTLTQAMNTIHTAVPNAKLALFNVPDVTAIPFFTTFSPFTLDTLLHTPVALLGPSGPLATTDLITLSAGPLLAAGHGFPLGSYNYVNPSAPGLGDSLPDAVVLNATEKGQIQAAVTARNAAIDSVARRPWIAKVDLNGLLTGIAVNGYQLGSTHYTSAYVTGGLFSLDGIHPNDLAHAVIANAMIDAVNLRFGATIPRINPTASTSTTSSSTRPVGGGPAGAALTPYGNLPAGIDRIFRAHR